MPMKMMRLIAALAMPLLLTGCLLFPGKFTSTLDVQRDGSFTFTYAGELVIIETSTPPAEFSASGCYDETTYEDRTCTAADLEKQRKEFDENQAASNNANKDIADFASDDSIAELVEQLKKQEGWKSVSYRGNRIIDVEYAITGTMSHGFSFPMVDGGAGIMPFVTMTRRKDGSVKVIAPAFSSTGIDGYLVGLGGMAGAGATDAGKPEQFKADGTFIITTDGNILTNNTEEGPTTAAGRSTLQWVVNSRLDKSPEALIGLAAK